MTGCSALTKLTNTTVFITAELILEPLVTSYSRSAGVRVSVSCQEGLELVGPSDVTCAETGLWWPSKPYCRVPLSTTPATTTKMDEPLILIIVLVVVIVFVAAVIVVICLAIFCGRHRNKKDKQSSSYYDDQLSQPYSISEHHITDGNNINMYSMYPTHPSTSAENQDGHRREGRQGNYNSYYNNNHSHHHDRPHDKITQESNIQELNVNDSTSNAIVRDMGDHYYVRAGYTNDRINKNDTSKCAYCNKDQGHMRHAHSLIDTDDNNTRGVRHQDNNEDRTRRTFRRDGYLWHSMHSLSDWSIPRPQLTTEQY